MRLLKAFTVLSGQYQHMTDTVTWGTTWPTITPIKIAQAGTPAGCPEIVFLGCAEYKTFKNVFGINTQNALPIAPQEQAHTQSPLHLHITSIYRTTSRKAGRLGASSPQRHVLCKAAAPEGVRGSRVLKSHQVAVGSSRGRALPPPQDGGAALLCSQGCARTWPCGGHTGTGWSRPSRGRSPGWEQTS